MAVGRPPKPTALKVLNGNPGKRPINKAEPKPQQGAPEPPSFLSPEGLREWQRIVPLLDRMGLLTYVDRAMLVVYCEAWSRYMAATQVVQEEGVVIESYKGTFVRHPAALVAKDAEQIMRQCCSEFGLSPSARSRMTVPGGEEVDRDVAGILSA